MAFIKIQCEKCNNEQVVFESASSAVKCLICNAELVSVTGGKAKINAKVIETFK